MFEEDKNINDLTKLSDAITNELNKTEQSIAQIALSLFYDSVYSTQVYDQILKVWFAIEVLCKMPGEHKKQPVKESLIKIYGDNRFDAFVDLLYQIRNAIVHDGYSGGVFGGVIGVGHALFYDLFADYCKITSPRMVEKAMDFYSLDIDKCKSDFQAEYDLFFK